jgi:phosphoglycolate phosphatase-like HAD superfamily hydrolase
MSKLIVVDTALADVDGLIAAAADYLARRLGGTPPLDPAALPTDAAGALAAIDAWAGAGAANWRTELTRFFEAHAPVHLVPDPEVNAVLRRAAKAGHRMAVASALPATPLDLELQQLGCARAFTAACAGDGSLDDAISAAQAAVGGHDTPVVRTRAEVMAALAV